MRNFFLAVAIFISMIATAEAQNSFAYQAVIRTAQGELVSNQKVGMRFSLIYNKETVYCETHTPETNKYGNVQVEVGKGQKVSGDFAAVPWSTMQVMMKIEADPNGGTNYIDLGTIQLQPAPYAMYAPTAGAVSTVQAGEPKSDGDALFEVKDKDGNVVFAVYPDGVRVFVDDSDSTANKAMSTGFAVQGRRAAKDGGDANIFAVNTSGTQVLVGEEDTAGGKPVSTGFAVQGRRAAKDGSSDLFKVSSTGTQIYIGEQDGKPVSTGFAVQGRRAAKDGENDKYLEINPDGTRVYIDDADSVSGKPVSTGFAVQGRRAAKGDSDSKYLEINANGTQVFVDDTDDKPVSTGFAVQGRRAAKGNEPKLFEVNQYGTQIYIDTKKGKPVSTGFAVQGRRAGKNANTNKYMVIDADGTRVYVDYEEAKAMQTGFAVQGRRAAKDGAQNTILEVNNVDGTRVYIDDIDGKAMPTGFAVSGRRAGKEDNNFLDINNNKITLANKQLAVGNTTTEANTLVMTGESTTIVTDVFLLAEKETEEPLLIADNKSGVDVNTNLVVRGEVGQNVKTEEVEDAAPDTIMVASVIETLACAELAAALGDADGYALLKIHGNGLFTQPQELDAAGNTSILFDVYGKMTTYRESAVVAVIMTNAATPDAKVLIWPLKQTNGTNISFGLTTAGGTDQYVNVLACINAKGGVECKFNAIASDSNLGEVKVEGTKVYGDVVRIEATTIKKGYHFAGWSDGVETNPRSVMVAGDSTITALFEPNPYNVTLAATNGHIEGSESGIFHYGTKLTLEAVADDHYHFVGWSNGSTDNPYTLEVEDDLELTANFVIDKYIVTFDANGGVFAEGAATTTNVTYNQSIGAFPAVERNGYILTGWTDDKGNTVVKETLVTGKVTLYAQWLQTTYYVADADNNGSANGDGTSENPYASINNALDEMIDNGTDTVYTICVKGTLAKDNTVIPEDLNGKIRRLIIEGDGGQMEINENTGESQYVPGGTLTIASEYGRVLGVETSVPVILRNITITGGKVDIYHSTTMDDYNGGGILVDEKADLTIADGAYIVGNQADDNEAGCGGGVFVIGKLTMTGGEISNNEYTIYGGGVYVAGEFTMTGGTISGNAASDGGGVFVAGKFTMTGGTINCNKDGAVYVSSYGTFRMGGSAYIPFGAYYDNVFETKRGDNDVQLCSSNGKAANITIISDLSEQAPVATFTTEDYTSKVLYAYSKGNDVEEDVTLLKNNYTKFAILPRYYYDSRTFNGFYYDYRILETGYLQHFCSLILYLENENGITPYGEPQTLVEGDKLEKSPEHPYKENYQFLGWHRRTWNGWDGFETKVDSLVFPYKVTAEDDTIVLVGQWAQNVFYVKQDGNDSNGGTSTNDALATIDGAVRKMCNSNVDYTIVVSGTLKGIQTIADQMMATLGDTPGGQISTIPIQANSITLCGETSNEVDMIDCGWFFNTSHDGFMDNNYYDIEDDEFNVRVSALTIATEVKVTIENLTITRGYAESGNGGGIFVNNNSNVVIGKGALITDNNCSKDLDHAIGGYGGGVYVAPYANLSLTSEGLISENAAVNGGGVFVAENATFNMDGGLITRNIASNGGGVCVANGATLTMTNGQIARNIADDDGGGIFTEGTFTMTGGTIGGSEDDANTAKNGGGILCYSATIGGKSTENRPEISYNTANNNGGGVAAVEANSGTITITNAIISNNTADKGGGLYQGEWTKMSIGDGTLVTGNMARIGSGFSFGDGAAYNLVMTGGVINGSVNITSHSIIMSGGATVDTVCLGPTNTVEIAGALAEGTIVTITPSDYSEETQVLSGEAELIAAECSKFDVTPEVVKGASEGTDKTQYWYVGDDGYLRKCLNVNFEGFEGSKEKSKGVLCGAKIDEPVQLETMTVGDLSYTFKNWYTIDAEGNFEMFSFNDAIITCDSTIYALWDCNTEFNVQQGATSGNGTFGSIADAVAAMNYEYANYTVKVVTDLSESQEIKDQFDNENFVSIPIPAASIILLGEIVGDDTTKINADGYGSALLISTQVPVTIRNLKITGGNASEGGGISAFFTKLTIEEGCSITGNEASKYGGGIYMYNGNLIMNGGSITNNKANALEDSKGGGIYAGDWSNVTINDGTISNNSASDGGGVCVCNPSLDMHSYEMSYFTINGGTFSNNIAGSSSYSGDGGFAWVKDYVIITITGGDIINNEAQKYDYGSYGGGIYFSDMYSTLTMTGGTISGNQATNGSGVSISGPITLGGSAKISDEAHLRFQTATVTVTQPFAKITAVLTPDAGSTNYYDYFTNNPILVPAENISDAEFASMCGNFEITPEYNSKTGDTARYYINAEGKLQKYIAVHFRDCDGVATQYFKPGGEETIQEPEPKHEAVEGVTFKFKGWYVWNGATNEYDVFTSFNTVPTGDIEIWALWDAEITVTDGGTVGSLEVAAGLMTKNDYDYTIKINGTLTGPQTISQATAKSITITGANELVDGNPQDIINGNSNGSALTISTGVQVTIENLKITGGTGTIANGDIGGDPYTIGGGLFIGSGANVTIDGNVVICNNQADFGGGVCVVEATFNMNDGATIQGNTAISSGGGVFNTDATFNMSGGIISGNKVTNGSGGGVYNNGSFYIKGDAKIAANNDVYLQSGKTITVLAPLTADTVAVVTPYVYSPEVPIIDSITGVSTTTTNRECGRFFVTPQTGGTYTEWWVKAAGVLTAYERRINVANDAAHPYVLTKDPNLVIDGVNVGSQQLFITADVLDATTDRDYYLTFKNFERIAPGPSVWCIGFHNFNANTTFTYHITLEGENISKGYGTSAWSISKNKGNLKFIFDATTSGSFTFSDRTNEYFVCNQDSDDGTISYELADDCTFSGTIDGVSNEYTNIQRFFEDANQSKRTCRFTITRKYVDLGLPSHTLWATCNLGATNPEGYGDYFAWGETSPYFSVSSPGDTTWTNPYGYAWTSYSLTTDGGISFTKYTGTNSATLEAADDAATANWGSGWSMPTTADFKELKDYCRWVWDQNAQGYIVYSKAEGNNNSIFLPAAGGFADYGTTRTNSGIWGFYWTSSLNTAHPESAFHLEIANGKNDISNVGYPRKVGFTVRPVKHP
jgi:uncharacterized repeat protein (TIGR02543 family)